MAIPLEIAVSKLQKSFRSKRALNAMREKSSIDIAQASQKNILNLYARLRTCEGLPDFIRATIQLEKTHSLDILTPLEHDLYIKLLEQHMIVNHATFNAKDIVNSGYFYSTVGLKDKNIRTNSHTSLSNGQANFVFFSFGYSNQVKVVNFLSGGDVFTMSLDSFSEREPELYASTWISGHFYAYDMEQILHPINIQAEHGVTRINLHHEIKLDPLINYQRNFTFQHNNTIISHSLTRNEEISLGRHIKPYQALRFIEYLRYLDAPTRATILQKEIDFSLIAEFYDVFFTPGKYELHVPYALPYDCKFFNLENRQEISISKLKDCIEANDIVGLKVHLENILPLATHVFNTPDNYKSFTLLNQAVLKRNLEMVKLLMAYGLSASHEYINCNQHPFGFYANRRALQDAIEIQDLSLIKQLCHPVSSNRFGISYAAHVSEIDLFTAIADNVDESVFNYLLENSFPNQSVLNKALTVASFYNNTSKMIALIKAGADINGHSTIKVSASNAHLISYSLSRSFITPLYIAAYWGRVEAVEVLLQHSADPNQYLKEDGSNHAYGIGHTPLMGVLKHIKSSTKDSEIWRNLYQCRFEKIINPTLECHEKVIAMLIAAGANLFFQSGDGASPISLLKDLQKTSFLEELFNKYQSGVMPSLLSIQNKSNNSFKHRGYALVTAQDEAGNRFILSGKHSASKKLYWIVPGGIANYQLDKNLKETAIAWTALQANLDLKNNAISEQNYYSFKNDDVTWNLEVHHFSLKTFKQICPLHISTNDLDLRKREATSYNSLQEIQWINIAEITVEFVEFKGVDFPIFFYRGIQFPYPLTGYLISLLNIQVTDLDLCQKLAHELDIHGKHILLTAIEQGDLKIVNQFLLIKYPQLYSSCSLLESSLIHSQYEITRRLVAAGIRTNLGEINDFNTLASKVKQHPEDIVQLLFESHQPNNSQWTILLLSFYAGRYSYINLMKTLYQCNNKLLEEFIAGAFSARNITSIQSLSLLHLPTEKNDEIANIIKNRLNYYGSEYYEYELALYQYLIDFYTFPELNKKILLRLCHLFECFIEINIDNQLMRECILQISFLINQSRTVFKCNDVNQIYGVYLRVMVHEDKKHQFPKKYHMSQTYVNLLLNDPIFALRHADFNGDFQKFDMLLAQNIINQAARDFIINDNVESLSLIFKKDSNGNNSLQRAIKSGSTEVAKFLIDKILHGKKEELEELNSLDSSGNTPLVNAILLGQDDIVTLLEARGATAQYGDRTAFLDFIKTKGALTSKQSTSEFPNTNGVSLNLVPTLFNRDISIPVLSNELAQIGINFVP